MLAEAGVIFGGMAVCAMLVGDYRKARRRRESEGEVLFGSLLTVFQEASIRRSQTAGSHCLTGLWNGERVEIRTITDTLALRKLPSFWLMITLPGRTDAAAKLDLMMRPAAQSSFSKFDFLPDTVPLPSGFPEEAIIRSDNAGNAPSPERLRALLAPFLRHRGKEILLAPEGVRIVLQWAEADRARYGVFRQARFELEPLKPDIVLPLIEALLLFKRTEQAGPHEGRLWEERVASHA